MNNERKNHKYIARIRIGTKRGRPAYRYFYNTNEYQRYLRSKRVPTVLDKSNYGPTEPIKTNGLSINYNKVLKEHENKKVNSFMSGFLNKKISDISKSINRFSTSVKNFFTKERFIDKPIREIKTFANKVANSVSNTIQNTKNSISNSIANTKKTINNKIENAKKFINSIPKNVEKDVEKIAKTLTVSSVKLANATVKKGEEFISSVINDKNNMYNINPTNYKAKVKQVSKTQEWREIVARNDPEYVRKDQYGNKVYLIDDYIVKKKHPIIDAISDITNGREITINDITKDSALAGIIDYGYSMVSMALLAGNIGSRFMTEKFKFVQGSYDDEITNIINSIDDKKYAAKKIYDTQVNKHKGNGKTVNDALDSANKIAEDIKNKRAPSQSDILTIANVIASSNTAQKMSENNKTVNEVVDVLATLSDEDIRRLKKYMKEYQGGN